MRQHENGAVGLFGGGDEGVRFVHVGAERLLHEDVLARLNRFDAPRNVLRMRRRHNDGIHLGSLITSS
jgi:hypothetical protein